jgi:phage terminase large subunit-like protein
VREWADHFKAENILIEDKSSGAQLIQELTREGLYAVTRYDPQMHKVMRLHSVTTTIENGIVHLPEKAEWLGEYLHEMTSFPKGRFDDQCDSTSQALNWIETACCYDGFLKWLKKEATGTSDPQPPLRSRRALPVRAKRSHTLVHKSVA